MQLPPLGAVKPGAGASSTASDGAAGWSSRARRSPRRVRSHPEQLHLDVARRQDLAFEIDRAVAEGGRRLRRPAARAAGSSFRVATRRIPRPPPPAAALTSNGNPIRSASATIAATWSGRSTGAGSSVPGDDRDVHRAREPAGMQLVPERVDRVGRRADEDESRRLHRTRERARSARNP
jgi:hypothetical protein